MILFEMVLGFSKEFWKTEPTSVAIDRDEL